MNSFGGLITSSESVLDQSGIYEFENEDQINGSPSFNHPLYRRDSPSFRPHYGRDCGNRGYAGDLTSPNAFRSRLSTSSLNDRSSLDSVALHVQSPSSQIVVPETPESIAAARTKKKASMPLKAAISQSLSEIGITSSKTIGYTRRKRKETQQLIKSVKNKAPSAVDDIIVKRTQWSLRQKKHYAKVRQGKKFEICQGCTSKAEKSSVLAVGIAIPAGLHKTEMFDSYANIQKTFGTLREQVLCAQKAEETLRSKNKPVVLRSQDLLVVEHLLDALMTSIEKGHEKDLEIQKLKDQLGGTAKD